MDNKVQKEIEELRSELNKYKSESLSLKKAIWDMLNYANMYVLILDKEMTIKLCNWSLAVTLGFKDESELIERCWLDFIPESNRDLVKQIHAMVKICEEQKEEKYKEVVNDILLPNGDTQLVRWFNMCINHSYNMTFSIGISQITQAKATDESIRAYYMGVIEKDRTMIHSLRDFILSPKSKDRVCTTKQDLV
jgi:PAS domain-containing protein